MSAFNAQKDLKKHGKKYSYMEKPEPKPFDVKHTAHKFVEKLHVPINHFVHQPRDEHLIDDDYLNMSKTNFANTENGGFSGSYTNYAQSSQENLGKAGKPFPDQNNNIKVKDTRIKSDPTGNQKRHHTHRTQKNVYSYPAQIGSNRPSPHDMTDLKAGNEREMSYGDFQRRMSLDSLYTVDRRKTPTKGSVISFHNISYKAKSKKYPWSKPVTKTILNNVNGMMLPGVNAIMGPTGSGKSSILDVLAGRKDPKYLEGKVLIDGMPQPKNFKCVSGYVVQDDIVMGTLTVRENLEFSAALRLSLKISKDERSRKVTNVINELGLAAVADSKIGTELLRGVSGGERKRCNIGMELITDPRVLFLDEPTTGLDAFTAASVIKTLQRLSQSGKTIILSIHQPKYSIYKLFDRYTLMAKGRIIYHGKSGSAPLLYFQNLGYKIEAHNNPADFYIDIINGEVRNEKEILNQQVFFSRHNHLSVLDSSGEYNDVRKIGRSKSDVKRDKKMIIETLATEWQESENSKELRRQLSSYDVITEDETDTEVKSPSISVTYATPWGNQMRWLCWRTALNLLRNPQTSTIQLGVYLFFAVSMGVVYFGLKNVVNIDDQNRYGLFFFAALQVIFVNLGAIEIFIKERPIFIHENSSGYYRVSSYFFAKLLCDMVPIKVFPAIVFLPITYFMAKLRYNAEAFFFFELILLLTTAAGCSIAFFVSASFSVFGLANVVCPIIYVFMMVFSGYFININSIFSWINWCRYLSAFRYALGGLSVNEMRDQCYTSQNTTDNKDCQYSGNDFLSRNNFNYTQPWDLWQNPLGLALITLFFLILCYIQLRRINKYK